MEPSSSSTTTAATSAETQPPVPTHFFTELFTLDHLVMTSSSSKRSRLTCIAVSPHFLFLGTSTGGVSAYSRYASARKRIKSPSGPYHFVNTKDGPVSTLCVNLQEGLVAVGNDSGRVHIVSFSTSSPSPIIQTLTKDTRKLDKVTSLVWSEDAKKLYSGHANGVVMAYHLGTKSPFRTACTILATFNEGEIIQLDISGSQLLISTQLATYVYDLEEKTTTQVGKKPRSGRMGACFFPMSGSSSQVDNSAFVLAARPNGRVWEANTAGVVYRTHQLRENSAIPRPPIISSRTDYSCDMTLVSSAATSSNEDVQLGVLHRLDVDGNSFILSSSGSKMIVFDVDQSKIILVNDLEEEIQCLCVCAADVFVIFRDLPIPRKYTLCDREMVVKKLLAKSLAVQSAQFVLSWKDCSWPVDILNHVAESLSKNFGKANVERLRAQILGLLEQQKSHYDSDTKAIMATNDPVCVRLPSGIHRVVNKISEPLDEPSEGDALPRRKRYRSRSCAATRTSSAHMPKRKSFPQIILSEEVKRIRESRSEIVSSESLRTLLQLRSRDMLDAVKFVPTITIGNAAKSLAALAIATPINFSCLVPAEGRKVTDEGRKAVKRRSGPSIVKAVRPCKAKPVASVRPLLSRRSVKPIAAVPTDEDRHNNCENSNDTKLPLVVPETTTTTECVIAYNDGENNVDLNLVMDRLTQIQIQNVTNDNAPLNGTPHIEEIKEPPPAPSSSTDCCEECGIHRSWPAAAMLAKVCRRIKINKNQFSFGAVPSLHSDWKQLLEFRFTSKQSNTSPCARCETAVCSCLSIFGQGSTLLDFVPEKVRPNPKTILERCASIDEDRMSRILFEESALSPTRTADEVQLFVIDACDLNCTQMRTKQVLQNWWNQAKKVDLSVDVFYDKSTIKEFGMMVYSKSTAFACSYGKCMDGSSELLCLYNRKPQIGEELYMTGRTVLDTCSACMQTCSLYLCQKDCRLATPIINGPKDMCNFGKDNMGYYLQKMARDMHNHYRRLLATGFGRDRRDYAPPAKAMQQLSYDCDMLGELSRIKIDCNTDSYTADQGYSINYYIYDKVAKEEALQKAIEEWYRDGDYVDIRGPNVTTTELKKAALFANMMRQDARNFGCSVKECKKQGTTHVICQYDDDENLIYTIGDTCKGCPKEKCDSVLYGLCPKS